MTQFTIACDIYKWHKFFPIVINNKPSNKKTY